MTKKILTILIFVLMAGCGPNEQSDGEPIFPPLNKDQFVVDMAGVLNVHTVNDATRFFEGLRQDKIADVVLVVQPNVKIGGDWATNFGRIKQLGEEGLSMDGGSRSLVWLIVPNASGQKIHISVGDGLWKFTAVDYSPIGQKATDWLKKNPLDFNGCARIIIDETCKTLHQIYDQQLTTN